MPYDTAAPVHKCPHCGRFVDMATGFYAHLPNAAEDDFVRLYCSEEHQQAHAARVEAEAA